MNASFQKRLCLGLTIALALLLNISRPADGQTVSTWIGNGDGTSWENGSNWSGSVTPSNSTTQFFDVEISPVSGANSNVVIGGGSQIRADRLTIDESQTLTIGEAESLSIVNSSDRPNSGMLDNAGLVTVGANEGKLQLSNDSTITGGGTIRFTGGFDSTFGDPGATPGTTTNDDNTLEGSGGVILQSTNFTNGEAGTIDANQSGGVFALTVDSNAEAGSSIANRGTLRASNGGRLFLGALLDIDNEQGTIIAEEGAIVQLRARSVSGGRIESRGTGRLTIDGGFFGYRTLKDVQLVGNINVGQLIAFEGNIDNQGTVLFPRRRRLRLPSDGTVELTGGGRLVFNSESWIDGANSRLENVDQTLEFNDEFGIIFNGVEVMNYAAGVIESRGTFVELRMEGNQGTIRSIDGGGIVLRYDAETTFENTGRVELIQNGNINVASERWFANAEAGIVSGEGTIFASNFTNSGLLAPEAMLTIEADTLLETTSVLEIGISGSENDQLFVDGSLQLGGRLSVLIDEIAGFDLDEYEIISYDLEATGSNLGFFTNLAVGDRILSSDGDHSFLIDFRESAGVGQIFVRDFQAVGVPEPSSVGLCLLFGLLVLSQRTRSIRR